MSESKETLSTEDQSTQDQSAQDGASSVQKIHSLLRAKDDTSRFVGLALLKSVLDNSEDLRHDEVGVSAFWESIPSRFLDRLLRSGQASSASRKDAKDMLDLAVSVLHTFAALLPNKTRDEPFVGRIPRLVACLLYRYRTA